MQSPAVLELSSWLTPPEPLAPECAGDQKADVVVIGGGYTGLSTALSLKERGVDVMLLEQEFCGYGASGRNAGHLTPTIGKDAPTLALMFGEKRGAELMRFADRAVVYAEQAIERHGIACDYLPAANSIAGVHPRQERALRKAAEAGARLGARSRVGVLRLVSRRRALVPGRVRARRHLGHPHRGSWRRRRTFTGSPRRTSPASITRT